MEAKLKHFVAIRHEKMVDRRVPGERQTNGLTERHMYMKADKRTNRKTHVHEGRQTD